MTSLARPTSATLPCDDLPTYVQLADGANVLIRAATPADQEQLRAMFYRLSAESAYFWAFVPAAGRPRWAEILASLAIAEFPGQCALVACVEGETVGIARYDRAADSQEAELGIIIEDRWQSRGLGRLLARQLASIATCQGIPVFNARVLGENRRCWRMLGAVFAQITVQWYSGEAVARLEGLR
ncbi:MAG TPA: GNAT family N-acetyltransferase [Ktedonobacterales bacterium]|jgi:RimJ/RimL family protein N-acetyltransferase